MNKRKLYGTLIGVIAFAILVVGATFAWLTYAFNATNGVYNTATACFEAYYQDNGNLSGTLDYSVDSSVNLNTVVSLGVPKTCASAKGTISLNVLSDTSSILYSNVPAHCEDDQLYTLTEYTTESTCTSNDGSWVTNGSALKYLITDENKLHTLAQGYITTEGTQTLYDNFYLFKSRTSTALTVNYYIYIWLDGELIDETYNNQSFSGYVFSNVTQANERIPTEYQAVTYIKSSGTQYIMTDIIPTNTTGIYARIKSSDSSDLDRVFFGTRNSSSTNSRYWVGNTAGRIYFGWNSINGRTAIDNSTIYTIQFNYLNNRSFKVNDAIPTSNVESLTQQGFPIAIFTGNSGGNVLSGKTSSEIYDFIVSLGTNKIIGDFIPCYLKTEGTITDIGLFDIVSNRFYSKLGTGSFTYGNPAN